MVILVYWQVSADVLVLSRHNTVGYNKGTNLWEKLWRGTIFFFKGLEVQLELNLWFQMKEGISTMI